MSMSADCGMLGNVTVVCTDRSIPDCDGWFAYSLGELVMCADGVRCAVSCWVDLSDFVGSVRGEAMTVVLFRDVLVISCRILSDLVPGVGEAVVLWTCSVPLNGRCSFRGVVVLLSCVR